MPDVKYYRYTGDVHKVPYTVVRGTMGYLAPEILREESYGIAADVWSIGIILYELTRLLTNWRTCVHSIV